MNILLFTSHQPPGSGIFAKLLTYLICAITRGSHTHAALLVKSDESGHWVIEAFYPHVRYRRLADFELPYIDVYDIDGLTPEKEAAILAYAKEAVIRQTPYSVLNLFRFLAPIRALVGDGIKNEIGDPTMCSQFLMRAVNPEVLLLRAWPQDIDPEDIGWSPRAILIGKLIPKVPLGGHCFSYSPL